MNRRELKRGSVIAEVAVIFAICVLVTGVIVYYSQYYKADKIVTAETHQRAQMITNEVKKSVYEYPAYKWLVEYWYSHYDEMDIEYDAEYSEGSKTAEKCRILKTEDI